MSARLSFGQGHAVCQRDLGKPGESPVCFGTAFWIEANGDVICRDCGARYMIAGIAYEQIPGQCERQAAKENS